MQNLEIIGRNPIRAGSVAVTVRRVPNDKRRWQVHVGVFGAPDRVGMRPGRSVDLDPAHFPTAGDLRRGVGTTAALLAKQLNDTVDEAEAFKGAVEMLDEALLEMRKRGLA